MIFYFFSIQITYTLKMGNIIINFLLFIDKLNQNYALQSILNLLTCIFYYCYLKLNA